MKQLFNCLTRRSQGFLGFCLLALTAHAQGQLPDSGRVVPGSSTLVKIRPVAVVFGAVNLAVEQTIGPRGSVQVEVYQTVANGRFIRVLGKASSVAASFQYYPLRNQTAPRGLYVGPKLTYARLNNSSLVRLITFFDGTGEVALGSAQAVVGYQYCSRRNLVLDVQSGIGILHHLTYHGGALSGTPTTERRTRVGPLLPSLTLSVGYRFRHRQHPKRGVGNRAATP